VRNFEQPGPDAAVSEHEAPDATGRPPRAEIVDVWVEDANGQRMDALPHGEDLSVNCVFVSHEDIDRARLDIWVDSEDGRRVFGAQAGARVFAASTLAWDEPPRSVQSGERLHLRLRLRNGFGDGRLHVGCSLLAGSSGQDVVALDNRAAAFISYGGAGVYGLAAMDHELTLERRPPEGEVR
jgi:hypothetical protein